MEVDYDVYAEGEAMLGWLNATFRCRRRRRSMAIGSCSGWPTPCAIGWPPPSIEIAHFKMTLAPDTGNDLAVLNLVGTDGRAESLYRLADESDGGRVDRQPACRRRSGAAERDGVRRGCNRRRARRASPPRSSTASTSGRAGPNRRTGWRRHDDAGAANSLLPLRFAKIVPPDVKAAVLSGLSEANVEFDAVPDLCEMAARGDARLRELAGRGPLQIAACYPRAVQWLFAAAGAQLPERRAHLEHAGGAG